MKPPFGDVAEKAAIDAAFLVRGLKRSALHRMTGRVPDDEATAAVEARMLDRAALQASVVLEYGGVG